MIPHKNTDNVNINILLCSYFIKNSNNSIFLYDFSSGFLYYIIYLFKIKHVIYNKFNNHFNKIDKVLSFSLICVNCYIIISKMDMNIRHY